jgi:hypothetical protein
MGEVVVVLMRAREQRGIQVPLLLAAPQQAGWQPQRRPAGTPATRARARTHLR